MKKFKLQTILVSDYKEGNNSQSFQSSAKLIASNPVIDEAFESMHQSIMTKIKISANEDWIIIETIIRHSINIFECS